VIDKTFHPDFEANCRVCDRTPCVVVYDAESRCNSGTELCGVCFWRDRSMIDHERWNDKENE